MEVVTKQCAGVVYGFLQPLTGVTRLSRSQTFAEVWNAPLIEALNPPEWDEEPLLVSLNALWDHFDKVQRLWPESV